jgi:hypothetical protein
LLVVKGDIRIDPGVTQLDGLFVAQPGDFGGGTISTCANSGGSFVGGLLSTCRHQLLVNGAFVAQKVNLLRSYGSLRNSYSGETYNGTRPSGSTCSQDAGPASFLTTDCAAEVFNFGPEMYLMHPSVTPSSGPTKGIWDYVTALPPIR